MIAEVVADGESANETSKAWEDYFYWPCNSDKIIIVSDGPWVILCFARIEYLLSTAESQ